MPKNAVYWFDDVFNADKQRTPDDCSPRRSLVDVEQVTAWAKYQDERDAQPETFADAYKQTHLTETPF